MRSAKRKLPKGVSYHAPTDSYFGRKLLTLRDGTSKRRATGYFASPYEAADALAKLEREAKVLVPGRRTIEALLGEWMVAIETGAGSTNIVRVKTREVRQFTLSTLLPNAMVSVDASDKAAVARRADFAKLRGREIAEFDDADLRLLLEKLKGHGIGSRSIQVAYEGLRAVYRWAEQRRYVDGLDSPFRRVKKPEHRAKKRRALTKVEQKRLFDAIRNTEDVRARALLLMLATSGVRIGEALGLKWDHVNLDSMVTRVLFQATAEGEEAPLKTDESEREVFVLLEVVELLRGLRRTESPFVFSVKSGLPVSHANVRTKWFAPMLKRADLESTGLTPHGLRSVAASILATKVDPVTLARTFGWADGLKTAMKFYVRSGAEMQDDTRKAMMAALDGLA